VLIVLCWMLTISIGVQDAEPSNAVTWHIRTVDRQLMDAVHRGVTRSPTFKQLVDRLLDSDVIAYLERGDSLPHGIGGDVTFIAVGGEWRYIRVRIGREMSRDQRIAMLGHEMRHVVEIAEAPAVVGAASLSKLYGHPVVRSAGRDQYESRQAVAAQTQVARELADWRPPVGVRVSPVTTGQTIDGVRTVSRTSRCRQRFGASSSSSRHGCPS
jgi:hypothetical protein